ncbi:MAG: hypothetical protein OXI17_05400, partial [Gammaproteobacteria bacterium]|nr:hypothetical protein [Gammaproteobacteria bacterium]
MAVQRGQQSIGPHVVRGFGYARFQNIQIAHYPVVAQSGLRQQIHLDCAAMVFEPAQLEHELALFLRSFFSGFSGLAPTARLQAYAFADIDHLLGFGLGFPDVHYAPRRARLGLVAGYRVGAKLHSSVIVFLPCEYLCYLHRFAGYRRFPVCRFLA